MDILGYENLSHDFHIPPQEKGFKEPYLPLRENLLRDL